MVRAKSDPAYKGASCLPTALTDCVMLSLAGGARQVRPRLQGCVRLLRLSRLMAALAHRFCVWC